MSSVAAIVLPVPHCGASLHPITHATLEDRELLAKLTAWRNNARDSFFTQFEATEESTRRWLRERILPDARRLLFVIRDEAGPLGTIGFMNLTTDAAELDNLVRGERRGAASLVSRVEATLLDWLFEAFHLKRVGAAVLSSNFAARQLHQTLGFSLRRRSPLRRVVADGMISLVDSDQAENGTPEKLWLELDREDWEAQRSA
ncbi:MAG TPA: GNAT family N-acetyltransferase [Thermoanaerobaculia bacterium]|nr:GNAT family N-acetyltransferase [Thermoanaerobaculia bacterium]